MPDSKYIRLEDLFGYLGPSTSPGSMGPSDKNATKVEPIEELLKRILMDPTGKFVSYEDTSANSNDTKGIHTQITSYFKGIKNDASDAKKESSLLYHMCGTNTQQGTVDFGDNDYWGETKNLTHIVPFLQDKKTPGNERFSACVFASRNPYVSPATRGTSHIDFFLNYTPPAVANQIVPYLDVEFQLLRDQTGGGSFIKTPTLMRFLMGSRNNLGDDKLSKFDKILESSGVHKEDSGNEFSYTGMELFLMPQTLTNLGDGKNDLGVNDLSARLVRSKPFVPFASIEGFDVTVQNAGALKYAHKKGSLKLKIHDKSRLSEISEFIRGPVGFNQAVVWTSYGWLAPRGLEDENEYFSFINNNMMTRECWIVMNTSFSFDASGQVSLTLELVSKASKMIEEITIADGNGTLTQKLKEFQSAIQTISELRLKYSEEPRFVVTAMGEQVLNAAATGGSFADLKDVNVGVVMDQIVSTLKDGNAISKSDADRLSDAFQKLKGSGRENYAYDNLKQQAAGSAKDRFNGLAKGTDPFLAGKKSSDNYFDPDLKEVVSRFLSSSDARNEHVKEKQTAAKIDLNQNVTVVSFGKVFLHFVLPGIMASHKCDELQVFFYGLNDSCGPIRGHSIAEFPINVVSLAYAYADAVRSSNTEALPIQAFLELIISSQFSDQRAIGYGMSRFFKPFDPDKPKESQSPDKGQADEIDRGMNQWIKKYGSLKMPIIEMVIETGQEQSKNVPLIDSIKQGAYRYDQDKTVSIGSSRIIKRIHIYDKQSTPYRLQQQIIDSGDGKIEMGYIDKGALNGKIESIMGKLDAKTKKDIQDSLNKDPNSYRKTLENAKVSPEDIKALEVLARPGKDVVKIPKDRKSFKDALMKNTPTLTIGTNGSMIYNASAASKTDGLMGTINLMNSMKGTKSGSPTMSQDGLQETTGLPLRVVPMQLTMTTAGVPTAQLYQSFFVDFDTGTTIDNLYNCTQIQHNITQGKFVTQWTFAYTNGYGKFGAPPLLAASIGNQLKIVAEDVKTVAGKTSK